MAVQRGESTGDTGKPEPAAVRPRPDVEVRNTVTGTTASGVVQAHTITGGVHHHHHPAAPARPVPRQLRPAPHGFVGRVDHLADLDRHVPVTPGGGADVAGRQEATVIATIGGTGGIGKTWLVLTWAPVEGNDYYRQ